MRIRELEKKLQTEVAELKEENTSLRERIIDLEEKEESKIEHQPEEGNNFEKMEIMRVIISPKDVTFIAKTHILANYTNYIQVMKYRPGKMIVGRYIIDHDYLTDPKQSIYHSDGKVEISKQLIIENTD